MAGITLTRQRIHDHLKGLGHEPTDTVHDGETGRHRFWKTPWGHIFSAPDDDHTCPTWVFETILDAANRTRPVLN